MGLITFNNIDGVPIHYARLPVAKYGTLGVGPRTVRLEEDFHLELAACLTDLWVTCPWGKPDALVSGGCYVEKAGRHGEGRAIDIDAIWWDEYRVITRDALQVPVAYLGIESVLRRHFGTVLDFWFGHGHEDHFHVDNGQPQGWTGRAPTVHAETLYLQAALRYVHGCKARDGSDLDIDGILGPDTYEALSSVTQIVMHNPKDIGEVWNNFLQHTADLAFSSV